MAYQYNQLKSRLIISFFRRPRIPVSGKRKGTQLIVLDGECVNIYVMPRRPRICPAGICFHVINRAVARLPLFEKEGAYEAFERVLGLAHGRVPWLGFQMEKSTRQFQISKMIQHGNQFLVHNSRSSNED